MRVVSLVKRNGVTHSFLINGERLCMGAERLEISCGVPAGKEEQEFMERRKLDVCGRTTVSWGKM